MTVRITPPVHPGEYLREEFLEPLGLTPYGLAGKLGVPRTRIERLVREDTGVTPDTALRLARFFSMTPEFWINMQGLYDLTITEMAANADIQAIEPMRLPAA
ncbi:HigA family addiction module antitoxin [uncultured Devosia sp.]|uniref:HigA family addiction module antitoxin n=1 Tax=uncultured Devosia sp. TaxID=211434 RepID=UPI0035CC88D6